MYSFWPVLLFNGARKFIFFDGLIQEKKNFTKIDVCKINILNVKLVFCENFSLFLFIFETRDVLFNNVKSNNKITREVDEEINK